MIMGKKMRVPENLLHSKLTYAVVAELAILMVCLWIRPDFFSIRYEPSSGMLIGSLITILNRSAEITIIAMGMTLVIALGGTDISVGALVAVSGALALKFLRWDIDVYTTPGDYTVQPFVWVIVVPLAVCLLMGLFNGALVAKLNIQPIIATLILMVAGVALRRSSPTVSSTQPVTRRSSSSAAAASWACRCRLSFPLWWWRRWRCSPARRRLACSSSP